MASLTRRLRKLAVGRARGDVQVKGYEVKNRMLLEVLFGKEPAPTSEHESERFAIGKRFRALMTEFETEQPARFWKHLTEHYRGYDPKHDGPSRAMAVVADVRALLDEESSVPPVCGECGARKYDNICLCTVGDEKEIQA